MRVFFRKTKKPKRTSTQESTRIQGQEVSQKVQKGKYRKLVNYNRVLVIIESGCTIIRTTGIWTYYEKYGERGDDYFKRQGLLVIGHTGRVYIRNLGKARGLSGAAARTGDLRKKEK